MEVTIKTLAKINITKEDWNKYERVRESGKTNMFDLERVEQLSGLPKLKIRAIIENYEILEKEFKKLKEIE